jgi:hypothetical protein
MSHSWIVAGQSGAGILSVTRPQAGTRLAYTYRASRANLYHARERAERSSACLSKHARRQLTHAALEPGS